MTDPIIPENKKPEDVEELEIDTTIVLDDYDGLDEEPEAPYQ